MHRRARELIQRSPPQNSLATPQMTDNISPTNRNRTRRRRAHLKSRKGCSECKRRHIKCDEVRPGCSNCITTNRHCSFQDSRHTSVESQTNQSNSLVNCTPVGRISPSHEIENTFTAAHLAYLHHAESCLGDILALQGDVNMMLTIAIDNASTSPYLLDQMLALSAAHLASTSPSRRPHALHEAVELQTRALETFNKAKEAITLDNSIPMFMFATFLGVQVLGETLRNLQNNLPDFLDAFIGYARLHRGVRAVVSTSTWRSILHSDLQPLLYIHRLSQHVSVQTPGKETAELSTFLESTNLDPESILACQDALKRMQWVLDMSAQQPSRSDIGIQATIAWPLLIPQAYLDLLQRGLPEALLVFLFYAAVLHRHRECWVFGRAGSTLVNLISANVEAKWHDSPGWPSEVLFEMELY